MKLYHQNEKGEKYVSWTIFVWALGIIFVVFTTLSGTVYAMKAQLDEHNTDQQVDMLQIKTQLSQIQADLVWIKANFNTLTK
jgi:hypothetical protein